MGVSVLTASNAAWSWETCKDQTTITIEAIGGGGGGGGETGYPAGGGGGKGGGYSKVTITKGVESSLNITVGAGGAAGSGGAGGNGGYSSVVQNSVTVLLAPGGYGGAGGTTNYRSDTGGTTANGVAVGDVTRTGGNGGTGSSSVPRLSGGGGGAGGPSGNGGNASANTAGAHGGGNFDNGIDYCSIGAAGRTTNENNGLAGPGVGAGGSGGLCLDSTNHTGGAGYRGVVVITWVDFSSSSSSTSSSSSSKSSSLSSSSSNSSSSSSSSSSSCSFSSSSSASFQSVSYETEWEISSSSSSTSASVSSSSSYCEEMFLDNFVAPVTSSFGIGNNLGTPYAGQIDWSDTVDRTVLAIEVKLNPTTGSIAGLTFTARIWSIIGDHLNVELATSQGVPGNDAWSFTTVRFNFPGGYTIGAGTHVAFTLDSGAGDASHYASVADTSNIISGKTGKWLTDKSDLVTWPALDMQMRLYQPCGGPAESSSSSTSSSSSSSSSSASFQSISYETEWEISSSSSSSTASCQPCGACCELKLLTVIDYSEFDFCTTCGCEDFNGNFPMQFNPNGTYSCRWTYGTVDVGLNWEMFCHDGYWTLHGKCDATVCIEWTHIATDDGCPPDTGWVEAVSGHCLGGLISLACSSSSFSSQSSSYSYQSSSYETEWEISSSSSEFSASSSSSSSSASFYEGSASTAWEVSSYSAVVCPDDCTSCCESLLITLSGFATGTCGACDCVDFNGTFRIDKNPAGTGCGWIGVEPAPSTVTHEITCESGIWWLLVSCGGTICASFYAENTTGCPPETGWNLASSICSGGALTIACMSSSSSSSTSFSSSASVECTGFAVKRFYFPSTGAAPVAPAYSGSWDRTSEAYRLALVSTKIGSAFTTTNAAITNASNVGFVLSRQYVSDVLSAQVVPGGNISGQIRAIESATGLNATVAFNVRVCDAAGNITQTVVDVQASDNTTSTPPEISAVTLVNRSFQNSGEAILIPYNSFTVDDGDRLVVEFGFRENNITAGRNVTFRIGDNSGTDLPVDQASINDYCPWIEFDRWLCFSSSSSSSSTSSSSTSFSLSSSSSSSTSASSSSESSSSSSSSSTSSSSSSSSSSSKSSSSSSKSSSSFSSSSSSSCSEAQCPATCINCCEWLVITVSGFSDQDQCHACYCDQYNGTYALHFEPNGMYPCRWVFGDTNPGEINWYLVCDNGYWILRGQCGFNLCAEFTAVNVDGCPPETGWVETVGNHCQGGTINASCSSSSSSISSASASFSSSSTSFSSSSKSSSSFSFSESCLVFTHIHHHGHWILRESVCVIVRH